MHRSFKEFRTGRGWVADPKETSSCQQSKCDVNTALHSTQPLERCNASRQRPRSLTRDVIARGHSWRRSKLFKSITRMC
jgi:hypothetical protein